MAKITGIVPKEDYEVRNIDPKYKLVAAEVDEIVEVVNTNDDIKTDKGSYTGTTGDLKDELDAAVFDGSVTYQTKALADAALPQPENTPCKIANDPTSTLNGNWAIVGGVWVQNDSVVSSIVDNEDISTSGDSLIVSNRAKDFTNTLGYYRIRSDFDWTEDLSIYANSTLEIIHDFDLGGGNVSIADNVTLVFNGGSFSNGNITGIKTRIEAERYSIFGDGLEISGIDTVIFPEWFGAKGDGVTLDGIALKKSTETGLTISLNPNVTYVNEKRLTITQVIEGNNAKIIRNPVFIDMPVLSALPSTAITVNVSEPDYGKLKIGMSVTFINREGDSRKVAWLTRDIVSIVGDTITLNASTSGANFDADTANITNQFPLLAMGSGGVVKDVTFEGGRDIYPPERAYWETGTTINTIIDDNGGQATIERCTFNESLADAIILGGQTTVKNNWFFRSGNGALHLSGTNGARVLDNYIFDSNLSDTLGHGFANGEGAIAYSTSVFDTVISGNIIDVCNNGIGLINSPKNQKCVISNNRIQNFRRSGIVMLSVPEVGLTNVTRGFTIVSNTFIGSQRNREQKDIDYSYTPTNPLVQSNGYGVSIGSFGNAGLTNRYTNIVVTGNNFRDCGVLIENTTVFSLTGNTFDDGDIYDSGVTATPQLIVIRDSSGVYSSNSVISNTTGAGARTSVNNLTTLFTTPPYSTKIGVSGNNFEANIQLLSDTATNGVDLSYQPDLNTLSILGSSFPTTSTDSGTSIVDTGIRYDTSGLGFNKASMYDLNIIGGNEGSQFKMAASGLISISTGFSGGNSQLIEYHELFKQSGSSIPALSVSVVFWDGATESSTNTSGGTANEIRVKISGYTAGQEGDTNQNLVITKRV